MDVFHGALLGLAALLQAPQGGQEAAFGGPEVGKIIADTAAKKHPYLLFSDIRETTGFKQQDRKPWSAFLRFLRKAAEKKVPIVEAYDGPTTGAVVHAGGRAHEGEVMFDPSNYGLLYQLTREDKYLSLGIEELRKLEPKRGKDDRTGEDELLARFLMRYCLLFDWLAASLEPGDREGIVRKLAAYADETLGEFLKSRNPNRRCVLAASLGVAGLALAGETVPTKSRPADWLTAGTVDLFIRDRYPWPASLTREGIPSAVEGTCNRGGSTYSTGYRSYWIDLVSKWLRIYSQATGRNPLLDFPVARRVLAEPVWSAMPCRIDPLQTTGRGYTWQYFWILWDLLPEREKAGFGWYAANDERALPLRPRTAVGDVWNDKYWFLWFPEARPEKPPAWRSFHSPEAEAFVFRGGWDWDSDWLHFKAIRQPIGSHRYMMHHDNMSFELYARGDYLLCDSSEVKSRMAGYGPTFALGHNMLLIDGRGPVKEALQQEYYRFVNPATVTTRVVSDGFDLAEAEMRIDHVEIDPLGGILKRGGKECNADPLASPAVWRRAILYPLHRYFVVVDSVASEAEHDYEFAFHFSSFGKENTESKDRPGRVKGRLRIGDAEADWSRGFRTEILTGERQFVLQERLPGAEADLRWDTRNLWDRPVSLRLYSVPRPDMLKVGRLWGYIPTVAPPQKGDGEVDHPFALLLNRAKSVERITVLLADDGEVRIPVERLPAEKGVAVSVRRPEGVDLIATGAAGVRAAGIESDARIVFLRLEGDSVRAAALVDGAFIRHRDGTVLSASGRLKSLAATFGPSGATLHYESERDFSLSLARRYDRSQLDPAPRDTFGIMFGTWKSAPREIRPTEAGLPCPAGSCEVQAR